MADLTQNVSGLAAAVEACRHRVASDTLDQAQVVLNRVDRRLSLAPDVTVVAIAGATGSGKSSLFNALSRTVLAEPGLRRPMTQQAMAITFGQGDTASLLDWLGIGVRHVGSDAELDSVVLIDLADHDSVVTSHRDEVDRLVEAVDEFLWVVDPQKYADAALHERYLRAMADHSAVMIFVLNQVDRLTPDQLATIRTDFIRLLREDGIVDPVVYEVSSLSGQGVEELRLRLSEIAATKRSMVDRLQADLAAQANALRKQVSPSPAGTLGVGHLAPLTSACMEAVGADQIVDGVYVATRNQGRAATGWPLLSWISRIKVNPLARLHLGQLSPRRSAGETPEVTRSSIPLRPIARARLDTAVRAVLDQGGSRLPRSWRQAMDRVTAAHVAALPDAMDQAVVSTDLGLDERHRWWGVIRVFQWLILITAVVGLVWLSVNAVLTAYLGLPALPTPYLGNVGLPTYLALGGVAAGLILAGVSRLGVHVTAKAASAKARRRLHHSIESVASVRILEPINEELQRHDGALAALDRVRNDISPQDG